MSRAFFERFLREALARQTRGIESHELDVPGEGPRKVWLKKAGARNARWRYALLGAVASLLRLGVLRPVMNLGGEAAIATEARRLAELAALGIRVPELLAQSPEGLLISDLGTDAAGVDNLLGGIAKAADHGPQPALAQWRRGLDAIADVHARGGYLSQAFVRNLVVCADGRIGFIDFEDDPGEVLPFAACQARDWLSYLQSTALMLADVGATEAAREIWVRRLASEPPGVAQALTPAVRRLAWARKLPAGRKWGTDTARLRAVAVFLAGEDATPSPSGRGPG